MSVLLSEFWVWATPAPCSDTGQVAKCSTRGAWREARQACKKQIRAKEAAVQGFPPSASMDDVGDSLALSFGRLWRAPKRCDPLSVLATQSPLPTRAKAC